MLHNDLIPYEGAGRILTEAALIIPAICGWNEVKQTGHNKGLHARWWRRVDLTAIAQL